jgi:transcriptional regulator with XRE-family HTH domain
VSGQAKGAFVHSKKIDAVNITVGARIKHLRLRKGLTQAALGEQIGVSFQQIQNFEKGRNRVSVRHLARFAQLFGVPVAALYSEVQLSDTVIRANAADKNVDRLVTAIQSLKEESLKVAVLRVAEGLVRVKRRKTGRGDLR